MGAIMSQGESMNVDTIVIFDGDSVIERPMNDAELEQLAKDRAFADAFNAEVLPKELAAAVAKAALLNKLGITEEEAKLLLS